MCPVSRFQRPEGLMRAGRLLLGRDVGGVGFFLSISGQI